MRVNDDIIGHKLKKMLLKCSFIPAFFPSAFEVINLAKVLMHKADLTERSLFPCNVMTKALNSNILG